MYKAEVPQMARFVLEKSGRADEFGIADVGNFFPPWHQVDLNFEKSGQSFYWALEFQNGAQKRN